jgi:hypothetical protein
MRLRPCPLSLRAPPSTASSTKAGAGGGPRVPIGSGPAALCTTEADDGNYTPCQSVGTIAKKAEALARGQTQVVKDLPVPCHTALVPLAGFPPAAKSSR